MRQLDRPLTLDQTLNLARSRASGTLAGIIGARGIAFSVIAITDRDSTPTSSTTHQLNQVSKSSLDRLKSELRSAREAAVRCVSAGDGSLRGLVASIEYIVGYDKAAGLIDPMIARVEALSRAIAVISGNDLYEQLNGSIPGVGADFESIIRDATELMRRVMELKLSHKVRIVVKQD